MRLVIDTNVLVSAVVRGGEPKKVIDFVIDSDCLWLVSLEILMEYKSVLSRSKFKLSKDLLQSWFEDFDLATYLIEVDINIDFPRDQKDAKFLNCAIAGQADFLITGDRDFEEVENLGKTKIISVSKFKSLVIDQIFGRQ
jgi:uncharacterized protein